MTGRWLGRGRAAPPLALVLGLGCVAVPRPGTAQGLTAAAPRAADVASLDDIVAAFYDVISVDPGESVDWARDSTLYLDGARFTILGRTPEGAWRADQVDHATYAADSDAFLSQGFHEREIHRETHRFGPMAQVFSTYEWRRTPDAAPGGRGINSIELFHDGDRWWMVNVMWASEGPDDPIPARFLPAARPAARAAAGSGDSARRPGAGRGAGTLELDDVRAVVSILWHGVSPDGERVAYLVEDPRAGAELMVVTGSGGAVPIETDATIRAVAGWSPSGDAIAFVGAAPPDDDPPGDPDGGAPGEAARDGAASRLWVVVPGEIPQASCRLPGTARSPVWAGETRIAFAARPEPGTEGRASPALASTDSPPGEAVFACDIASGAIERVTADAYHGLDFDWSPAGDRLAVSGQREPGFYGALETDLHLVDPATGSARALVDRPGVDRSPRWAPDGRRIAFVSGFGRRGLLPNLGIAVVDADAPEVLDIGREHDRGGFFEGPTIVGWSSDSRSVFYSVVDGPRTPLNRLSLGADAPARLSDGWDDGGVAYSYRLATDGETVVFKRSATDRPAELFLAETDGGSARAITGTNGSLAALGVPRAEVIRWTAGDGTEVEGLLLRPLEGRGEPPLPLVTILHGGPASAYTLGFPGLLFFNPYQDLLLAARGYAVFLPNPRGSGGYGQAFRDAARHDWADGPTDDVISGIDHLVAEGIADPDRLALAGWSYGGYLTAWILTRTDRFRVASVGAGVTDLESHHGQAPDQMQEYFGGPPWAAPDLYRRQSPMTWVDRITTPTLIFHGTADGSVSPSQSEQLHAALESLGVPTELVRYPGEGHSLRRPEAQDDGWRRFLEWVERWMGSEQG